jgi:hypothetical protein
VHIDPATRQRSVLAGLAHAGPVAFLGEAWP